MRDERLLHINTVAMSEVKALVDGDTTNTLQDIVDWTLRQIALLDRSIPAPTPTPSFDDVVVAALEWAAGRVGRLWSDRLYAAASDPDTIAAIIKTAGGEEG